MRHLLAAALFTIVGLTASSQAQSKIAGDWALLFNTPNGAIDASATFKVDGDKLTGTMSSQAGEISFSGSVKGDSFTFSFDVQTPNGNMTITMQGQQEGDALKGTFDFGQGMGDWTGKRK
jgi:hypothetical protein